MLEKLTRTSSNAAEGDCDDNPPVRPATQGGRISAPAQEGSGGDRCPIKLRGPKALLVSEIFPPRIGGTGRLYWEIYRRMPRDEVVIAAGEHPQQARFDLATDLCLRRVPLTMHQWGIRSLEGLRGYWRGFRSLRRLILTEGIQVIHAGRTLPEGLMARMLKTWYGIPYLCHVHGEEINTASTSRELSWLTRRVLNGAEFLIASSENTARLLHTDWLQPSTKVRVHHPGVDAGRFVPRDRDPAVRERLGWNNRTVVLTVGRLQLRKGQDQMILAMPKLREAIPDILYVIVGDGPEREHLRNLVAGTGVEDCVRFLGEPNDEQLIACYQQCDLFILPNRQVGMDIEGFGIVLLEAQACGKAVLAGTSGGTAETMRIPETGRVVSCEGPEKLASMVIDMLGNRAELANMGQRARQWVQEQFDWTRLAGRARQLFLEVPAGPKFRED